MEHVIFPVLSRRSSSSFYSYIISLSVIALLLQYLSIYKTVWWSTDSDIDYPLDFRLINFFLFGHCVNMLVAPRSYLLFIQLLSPPVSEHPIFRLLVGPPLFIFWMLLTRYLLCGIDLSHDGVVAGFFYTVLILYLPFVGLLVYHRTPLLQLFNSVSSSLHSQCSPISQLLLTSIDDFFEIWVKLKRSLFRLYELITDWPALAPTSTLFPIRYLSISVRSSMMEASRHFSEIVHYTVDPHAKTLQLLRHQCPVIGCDQIRDEVELYRHDFNSRLMDVFFGSSYTMYYGCLVPLLFVKPSRLFYDLSWCLQHSLFTWTTAFLLHWHHYIPSDYLDILHQSALHLGAWHPCGLSVRSAALQAWSPLKVYPEGSVVRHVSGQFRSSGPHTVAEPSNAAHSRFHLLFSSVPRMELLLLCVAIGIFVFQLISLNWVFEWHKLIGIAAMGPFGLFNVYIRTRDYSLSRRVYASEVARCMRDFPPKGEDYSFR